MVTLKDYERVKNAVKKQFEDERSGEQSLYLEQSKLLKPLIDEQKETTKTIQHTDLNSLLNALVPFMEELKKRNEQVDNLQSLPFYNAWPEIENIPQSTPKKDISKVTRLDLDKMLSETDRENLQDMSLSLPSEVVKEGNYETTLERIKLLNRQCGQFTGKTSKKDDREKQVYKSKRVTLEKYRMSLEEQMKALKYTTGDGLRKRKRKVYKMKRGKGRPRKYPDCKFYKSADDLVLELHNLVLAKEAGNTGLDNIIISALDELLNIKAITKKEFDELYKNFF